MTASVACAALKARGIDGVAGTLDDSEILTRVADHADEFASSVAVTEDSYFEPVPYRRPRVEMNRYVRQAAIEKGIRSMVVIKRI
jgi:hypothetical protein